MSSPDLIKLSELITDILEPDSYSWFVVKEDGTKERFKPLTLMESFIESEMDFLNAARIFDDVRERLLSLKKTEFTHTELQMTVIDCILESGSKYKKNWLRNYGAIFAPNFEKMTEDQGYVFARNAGLLKEYIVEHLSSRA